MIIDGKGDIEWERKIPDEKLGELKVMLDDTAFKKNLPKVIKRIYELAWEQFSDLPRGHHKVHISYAAMKICFSRLISSSPTEQFHAQVGVEDDDRDPPRPPHQVHRVQTRQHRVHPRLL